MFGTRKGLVILAVLGSGLVIAVVGFWLESRLLASCGGVAAGLGAFLGVHDSTSRGEIRTNWGVYRRDDHPTRFRVEAIIWYLAVAIWIATAFAYGLGLIGS